MSAIFRRLIADPRLPFVAIDFETANFFPDSACAVALIRVEDGQIVDRRVTLLKPPRRWFTFTHIHGLTWNHVEAAPTFAEAWNELSRFLEGATFLAAHNAGFDQAVLRTCCWRARLKPPRTPFECTLRLARKTWGLPSNKLPSVCSHLQIPLKHHDAESDAEACARIVLAAAEAARLRPRTSVQPDLWAVPSAAESLPNGQPECQTQHDNDSEQSRLGAPAQ